MPDVIPAVDSVTGAFGPLVRNRLQADMQSAINTGVTDVIAGMPDVQQAVADKLAPLTTDTAVRALVTSASTTRTALDKRYKKRFSIDLGDYLTEGSTGVNDNAAVQAAVNDALAATDPINVEHPVFNNLVPTIWVPLGTFAIDNIIVNGSIKFLGVGGGIYAASVFSQRIAGQSMIYLGPDTDNTSNATVFENITFKSQSGTSDSNVAQVKTMPNIGSNSVYFRNCWFKTPERYAIWMTQGDDIQITGCTFDVSAFNAIKLGSSTGQVSNCRITNCTFFNIAVNAIEALNVRGLSVVGNSIYAGGAQSTFFTTFTTGTARGVTFTGNTIKDCNVGFFLSAGAGNLVRGITITGNTFDNIGSCLFDIEGGQTLTGLVFAHNQSINDAPFSAGAAFAAPGSGVTASIITENSLIAAGSTPRVFNMPDARTMGNRFTNNVGSGFAVNNNFANPAANGA